jgi:hypothetical protein
VTRRALIVAVVVLAAVGCGRAAASSGFATAPRTSERRVACAVDATRLLCAWPSAACRGAGSRNGCYDGRAVIELLASGRVRREAAGSDVLLRIDRRAGERLATGSTWSQDGFRCTRTGDAVRCSRAGHGFTLKA